MNSTALTCRLLFIARQLRGEAERNVGQLRLDLIRASVQMFAAQQAIPRGADLDVAAAVLAAGTERLVQAVTSRAMRILDQTIEVRDA